MLLEFKTRRYVTCEPTDTTDAPAYVLINQITDLAESYVDGLVGTSVGLRSGRVVLVVDSVRDVLDALKFATRHIAAGPGIVDRTTGESEELYPWQRCEKVSVLAEKWRAHEKTPRRSGVPAYAPCEPDTRTSGGDGRLVDLVAPVPPMPPANRDVDPMMNGTLVATVSTGELIETFRGGELLIRQPDPPPCLLDAAVEQTITQFPLPPVTTDQPKEADVDQSPGEGS